jgi:serine/threonine-protein kinase
MSTSADMQGSRPAFVIGRYAVYDEIASGGMATVHLGRLLGPVGFTRTVAIKRLHATLSRDPEFAAMFLDEARLAARIRHPNVVQTLDVVARQGELFLVMDYVHGESLAVLLHLSSKAGHQAPLGIVGNLISGMLQGLHAAHEARSDRGEQLDIVHRDISPQNVLVGIDGIPRLLDFGIAKAMGRAANTRGVQLKGKISYISPEQIIGTPVTRATDIWGASIVLWQALTGRKLFHADNDAETLYQILEAKIEPPSRFNRDVSAALDEVVLKGLEREPEDRFANAQEMVLALEKAIPVVSQREVVEWVERVGGEQLATRARRVAEIENLSTEVRAPVTDPPPAMSPTREPQPAQASARMRPHVESGYMAGMAETLPPPGVKPRRATLLVALVSLLVAGATAAGFGLSRWHAASASQPAPTVEPAVPPPSAMPAVSAAAPEPSAAPAAPQPAASASALPSAPTAARSAAVPPKPRPTATANRPPDTKTPGGIYARE